MSGSGSSNGCACKSCGNRSCPCVGTKAPKAGECCCGPTCTCGPQCECGPDCNCPAAKNG
ncbi:MAG: hypothetical protein J0I07_36565 [Myxococcales bacterium]|nr:hypothetical protein [Myxococcales bacterium]